VEIAGRKPGEHRADPLADVVGERVGRPAQSEADVDREVADQSAPCDDSGAVRRPDEVDPRRSGDQRAIEVEEGGRPGVSYPSTLTITASP
jgi:hypothetical protein